MATKKAPQPEEVAGGASKPNPLARLQHWRRFIDLSQLLLWAARVIWGRTDIAGKRLELLREAVPGVRRDALDASIAEIDQEVDAGLACFRDAVKQLITIPGVSELSAHVIISEIGTDYEPVCHGRASALLGGNICQGWVVATRSCVCLVESPEVRKYSVSDGESLVMRQDRRKIG
jgi:hypothetical protein